MKIAAYFECKEFKTFVESVSRAEQNEYDRAWVTDGQNLREDTYVYMSHGLAVTDNLVFGTGVANPVTRHYTVTASAHATLAKRHPDRVILGMGRGDAAVYMAGLKPMSTENFARVVPRLKPLMAGETVEVNGDEIRIVWANENVPVMLAAVGPKNLRLAGALADIVQMQVGVDDAAVRWGVEQVHAGAEEAGREPGDVEISVLCPMWISDDLDEARKACRWGPEVAANHLEKVIRYNPGLDLPEAMTRIVKARQGDHDYYGGHLESSAEHTDYLTDELIDDFALAGPAEKCLQRIRELSEVGVDEIASAMMNGQFEQMDRVGSELIPGLKKI